MRVMYRFSNNESADKQFTVESNANFSPQAISSSFLILPLLKPQTLQSSFEVIQSSLVCFLAHLGSRARFSPRSSPVFLPISAALPATRRLAPYRRGPGRGTEPERPDKPAPGWVCLLPFYTLERAEIKYNAVFCFPPRCLASLGPKRFLFAPYVDRHLALASRVLLRLSSVRKHRRRSQFQRRSALLQIGPLRHLEIRLQYLEKKGRNATGIKC